MSTPPRDPSQRNPLGAEHIYPQNHQPSAPFHHAQPTPSGEQVPPDLAAEEQQMPQPAAQPAEAAQSSAVPGSMVPPEIMEELEPVGDRVIDTSSGKSDGLNRCPRCGSTEIGYSARLGSLVCGYCRFQWNEELADQKFGFGTEIGSLAGTVRGSGAGDIVADSSVVTIKCTGCGAEVVINPDEAQQAKCHWCRQILSINQQIPNGTFPDAILPFTLTHEQGVEAIRQFAGSRRFFAHPAFRDGFAPENVRGVYLPYMLVDGNLHARLEGVGERTLRTYQKRVSKDETVTVHDVAQYELGRQFDLRIDDLPTESSSARASMDWTENSNNIINAIQPFDTKNAVAYNSNYLHGFTSERRDTDIADLDDRISEQFLTIARARARTMTGRYDRGVRWDREGVAVTGTRWVSIYLPVWLYSHVEQKSDGSSFVHYLAVNGRTGQTMGSVPLSMGRLWAASCSLAVLATAVSLPIMWFMM